MLSIVIPAYNEEERLPQCLKQTLDYISPKPFDTEIIVVCDGCTDKTAEICTSVETTSAKLKVIHYMPNHGKGYAVKKGILEASGDIILFMDADYAVPIETLDKFIEQAESGYDIVIGARGLKDTIILKHQAYLRELAGKIFGRLQKKILKIPYNDTQCGFKLLNRNAALNLFKMIKYECSYFDAELMYLAYYNGYKIKEMPVEWKHDGKTKMPIGIRRTFDLLYKLIKLKSLHKYNIKTGNG